MINTSGMFAILLNDDAAAKLRTATVATQICDDKGNVLGVYTPQAGGERNPTLQEVLDKCPTSEEEIERRRQEGGGRPLADILRELDSRNAGAA